MIQSEAAEHEKKNAQDNRFDPSAEYEKLSKNLLKYGCDPATHREVYHSLDAYLHWLNGEKTEATTYDNKSQLSESEVESLRRTEEAFDRDFNGEINKKLPMKRFVKDVTDDYINRLSEDLDKEDPKTETEFYQELSDHFDELWKTAEKTNFKQPVSLADKKTETATPSEGTLDIPPIEGYR